MVTCTRNSEAFLEKALHSVELQNYDNIEHIINDSYSTDRTHEIIEAYISRNTHRYPIRVIHTEPRGIATALNEATKAACGEIIHFLHSDDYYSQPDSLQKVAEYFQQHPECVWLTGNFLLEYRGSSIIIPHTRVLKTNPKAFITMMNFIHHENTFMRRDAVFSFGGFCEDKHMNVEYRLWLRLIQHHQPHILNDQFTVFIIHKDSTSTGSLIGFSKAVLRGFNTLHHEKVFPLIGYYENLGIYGNYREVVSKMKDFITVRWY